MKLECMQLCRMLANPARDAPSLSLPFFVTGPSFSQGTERELTGRDRETALGFPIMLNVCWDFKDATELLGVTWLILLLWKKARRVIDFQVSLFKLALQPAGAEPRFSSRDVGVAWFPDYPRLMLLINQAQAHYNDWRMTHELSYQLLKFLFYFVEERWKRYKKYNSSSWQYFPKDSRFTGKERKYSGH